MLAKQMTKLASAPAAALQVHAKPEGENPMTLLLPSCECCCIFSGITWASAEKNCLWDDSYTSDNGSGAWCCFSERDGLKTGAGKERLFKKCIYEHFNISL